MQGLRTLLLVDVEKLRGRNESGRKRKPSSAPSLQAKGIDLRKVV